MGSVDVTNTFPFEMIGVEAALPGIGIDQRTFFSWLNETGTFLALLDPSMFGPLQLAHSDWQVMVRAKSKARG